MTAPGDRLRRMMPLRHRGAGGGYIVEHRAFATLALDAGDLLAAAALALCLTVLWFFSVNAVCAAWTHMLSYWQQALQLHTPVAAKPYHLGPWLRVSVPYLAVSAANPGPETWWGTAAVTLVLLAASFFVPKQELPLIYLLRLISLIQTTSLVYFAVAPAAFPHGLADYMADMLMASLALISIIPTLLGFTYYLFNFGLVKKLLFTLMIVLHLSLVVPFQYLFQAYLLHRISLLFMPLFYLFLGLPLDVMIVIAFYGWGMSWEEKLPADQIQIQRDHPRTSQGINHSRPLGMRRVRQYVADLTSRLRPSRSSEV